MYWQADSFFRRFDVLVLLCLDLILVCIIESPLFDLPDLPCAVKTACQET